MMQQKVNPAAAVGLIVVILALAVGAIYWKVSAGPSDNGEKPPPIPADATARLQTIMGNASGHPGGGGGMTAPPSAAGKGATAPHSSGGMTAPPSGGGGMTAPPPGGMTAPPSGGGQ
jgi:hypothetical protein